MAGVLGLKSRVVVGLGSEGLEAVDQVGAQERHILRRVREHVARVRARERALSRVAQPVEPEHEHAEALQRVLEQVCVALADL